VTVTELELRAARAALLDVVKLFDATPAIGAVRAVRSADLLAWMCKHMGALNDAAEANALGPPA
jgi:hypothetical protein